MLNQSNQILVSIIIPTYNRSRLLLRTVESILKQTYKEFELLIIDDGSTDDTGNIVESIQDHRISYHKIERTKDIGKVRNVGLSKAKSDVISFCDDDDLWEIEKLEKQMHYFGKYHFICSGAVLIDSNDNIIADNNYVCTGHLQVFDVTDLLVGNFIITSSVLFLRRKEEIFSEKNSTNSAEDYQFWLSIAENYPILKIDEPLVFFRVHGNTSSFMSNNVFSGLLINVLQILTVYKQNANIRISNYAKYGIIKNKKDLMILHFRSRNYIIWIKYLSGFIFSLLDIKFIIYYFRIIRFNLKKVKRVII